MFRFLAMLSVAALCTSGAVAQTSGSGLVTVTPFAVEGLETASIYTFDASYAAKYGVPVEVPFSVAIPRHKAVRLYADGKPDGGLVKFTFATDAEPRTFLENLHFVQAGIPFAPDAADPDLARLQIADRLMRERAFPMAVDGFQNPQLIGSREIQIGGIRSVELIGQYVDPTIGAMGLRILCVPHPDRPESYIALSNVNLDKVPLDGPGDFGRTLAGRAMESFAYK